MIERLALGDLPDQRHRAVGLAVVHAGGRLIEQNDLGTACDSHADFQRALLGVAERARGHVAPLGQPQPLQPLFRRTIERPLRAEQVPERIAIPERPEQRTAQIFENRHAMEQRGDLEAARKPPTG